jgi:hypothetical protein
MRRTDVIGVIFLAALLFLALTGSPALAAQACRGVELDGPAKVRRWMWAKRRCGIRFGSPLTLGISTVRSS